MSFSFKVNHQTTGRERIGTITTDHGVIETPAFVAVGTQGTIKSLPPDKLLALKTQIFFVNTYHMMVRPGVEIIKKHGGLHQFINWPGPLMTDSGGFQVFSLGRQKFSPGQKGDNPALVKIDKDGVTFRSHWDGSLYRLTASKSIEIQHELGADIIIAFDDCAPYPITYEKAKEALFRNHKWALESLKTHKKLKAVDRKEIALYGSIQGSVFQDLREESAKFIGRLDFDGLAIGGVAVGESKEEMAEVLSFVVPHLPENKPRHLLGVGEIDDIFTLVSWGIDTFDCVFPTRLARMGQFLINNPEENWRLDITKKIFAEDTKSITDDCSCYTCRNFSKGYLHHLFKVRELLAYYLATVHNLTFIENLMEEIRMAIKNDRLQTIREKYLKKI